MNDLVQKINSSLFKVLCGLDYANYNLKYIDSQTKNNVESLKKSVDTLYNTVCEVENASL